MKPKRFTEQVFVALSPKTKEKLEEISGKLDMSMSEYIRTRIEADLYDDSTKLAMRKSKPLAIQEKGT